MAPCQANWLSAPSSLVRDAESYRSLCSNRIWQQKKAAAQKLALSPRAAVIEQAVAGAEDRRLARLGVLVRKLFVTAGNQVADRLAERSPDEAAAFADAHRRLDGEAVRRCGPDRNSPLPKPDR